MNSFLAKCVMTLVKSKTKKQVIYGLLTNKWGGNPNEHLTLANLHAFESLCNYTKSLQNDNYKALDFKLQAQFKSKIEVLKQKIKTSKKIKICFYVINDSAFAFKPLFEKMQNNALFEPYIVIIPDIFHGDENMFYQIDKAYNALFAKYGNVVLKCYDSHTKGFIDFTSNMDILATSQPYGWLSDEIYSIKYATSKQILTIFASYGMETTSHSRDSVISLGVLNLCWKNFVNTNYGLYAHEAIMSNHGKNAILSGYIKMDSLSHIKPQKQNRKKIIIAPHHTLDVKYSSELQLSNFLRYADLFLEIYAKYPQIDFVFRPHPLLVVHLARDEYWGKQKLDNYLAKLQSFDNVEYQECGEYFETFVNSSGIVHDCGSFIAEYLYTDNPCCYMLKDLATNANNLSSLGEECLRHYYHAFSESDIIDFIENVILKGQDTKKEARIAFAKEVLRVNYPNVADKILANIKNELL